MATHPATSKAPEPPMVAKKPKKLCFHGHTRIDFYHWLKDRKNKEVIQYLEAENKYTASMTAHTTKLQKKLYKEIQGRIPQTDTSVPYKIDNYVYYARHEDSKAHPIYCRRPSSMRRKEQIILDVNKLAEGFDFYELTDFEVSSQQNILAYSFDTLGRRINTIRLKNLETGEILEDKISNVTGEMVWANDNKSLFYSKQDSDTLRPYQVFMHLLGTDSNRDLLIFEEPDNTYSVALSKSKSRQYLFISSHNTLSSEYHYLEADNPENSLQVFQPRQVNHDYQVDHLEDTFLIRTNSGGHNFRIMKTSLKNTELCHWKEVVPHQEEVLLTDFEIFKDFLAITEQNNGLPRVRIVPLDGKPEHCIDFGEEVYTVYTDSNPNPEDTLLRYVYSSMTTPPSTFDYDMKKKKSRLLKQETILGDFNSNDYKSERHYTKSRDGVDIPISLVYKKTTPVNGHNPLLLYGYGSYGISVEADFGPARLSLLNRGFVFAIAHIRGGQEKGRKWYENGRLFQKKNSFNDFVDCAEYLVDQGYADSKRLFAIGGSAGGLLMGAIMNMHPKLFKAIVAQVPFVDVVTTMLDESIPLTTSEYDEWGNPKDSEYYNYMLSYSPYDNVKKAAYPSLLVTTALHDSQVQFWEPVKWVAKLREFTTGTEDILLKTNFESGHRGTSDRYKRYEEIAFYYAFLIDHALLA